MKKLLFLGAAFMLLFAANSFAQSAIPNGAPNCGNANILNSIVQSEAAQGWDFAGSAYAVIDYATAPEAPYVGGFVTLSFVPNCEPNEICIQIVKIVNVDVIIQKSGNCTYKRQ